MPIEPTQTSHFPSPGKELAYLLSPLHRFLLAAWLWLASVGRGFLTQLGLC